MNKRQYLERLLRTRIIGPIVAGVTVCGSFGAVNAAAEPARFSPAVGRRAAAVGIEAEFFKVQRDWEVIFNGEGNYMVDIIGFQHIGGERLLGVDKRNSTAEAYHDVIIPEDGDYRLLVRYEYPPFSECRFEVSVTQGRRTVAQMVMGKKDNPRFAFNDTRYRPQYDPPWGAEGLAMEALNVTGLQAGSARIHLKAVEQPQIEGVTAGRHIDFVYMTSDMQDGWQTGQRTGLYPMLEVYRDTVGPRWEVRVRNRGEGALSVSANYTINREPWTSNEGNIAAGVASGAWSAWRGLSLHDPTHFHMGIFRGNGAFDLEIRPVGPGTGARTLTSDGNTLRLFIPPYGRWNESPVTPEEQLAKALELVRETPAPGREPTLPLAYGGWMPVGTQSTYNRKYGELYKAIGMRGFPTTGTSIDDMRAIGLEPNHSYMAGGYRNYPDEHHINAARSRVEEGGFGPYLKWFDYGDEIHFSEWVGRLLQQPGINLRALWQEWLRENRPGFKPEDYWMPAWGGIDPEQLRPDSSRAASEAKPRLFVDSTLFYQNAAIRSVADGLKKVKQTFGDQVLGGANYSAHPYYYPLVSMYVHWFRGGAADFGRHSEYFWQCTQPGPMINGYIVEHFRTGMRDIPHGIIRQYTMPHVPGNTDDNFRRTAFTHLAHGAHMLDYFGIGMNETFTENYIDHRSHDRYVAIRDLNYCLATVEDLMEASEVIPSDAAILLSDSTEIWDMAPLATDRAGHAVFDAGFRALRLIYHLERLGIWKSLTFAGESPDLIVEEDLIPAILNNYRLLYVVGDSLPPASAAAVKTWVENGGVLVATATAGQVDPYRNPITEWSDLLGIRRRTSDLRDQFARPRQELPFLQPYDRIVIEGDIADDATAPMPSLAIVERIEPAAGGEVLASFQADGKPAVIRRALGKGHVIYMAAFPGVAYLWQGLQPPMIPDRGVNVHTLPEGFDAAADRLIRLGLESARIEPRLDFGGRLIDARLIRSGNSFVLPLADYEREAGQALTLSVRVDRRIRKLTSAYHGELDFERQDGIVTVTLPEVTYGDILRME